MNSVHSKIKTRRLLAGLTVTECARAARMSGPQFSRLERGERRLYVHDLVKIARALGCKPAELIEENQEEEHAA